jgi:hypothetical protein
MGGRRGAYRVLVRKPEWQNKLEDLGVEGSIILKYIFQKLVESGVDSIDLSEEEDRWLVL